MKSVLEQGRDVDSTRSESQRLERTLKQYQDEQRALTQQSNVSNSMLTRIKEKILAVRVKNYLLCCCFLFCCFDCFDCFVVLLFCCFDVLLPR